MNVSLTLLQEEEERELRAQVSGLGQELATEKSQTTELQKALEQSQESHTKLQSDLYGKESEVSALLQDLEVGRGHSRSIAAFWENDRPPSFLSEWASEQTRLFLAVQGSQEKLKGTQEELAANQSHQAALENQIKELQASRTSLQQELAKLKQKLQQQEQNLQELQKQQVRQGKHSFVLVS